jgi:hypothetical protein
MKVFLMHRDCDFDLQRDLPPNSPALIQDLELNTLFDAMAQGDKFLFDVTRKAVLTGLHDELAAIRYRQDILRDCLKNPTVVRELYAIAEETIESRKKHWWGVFSRHPSSILYGSVNMMEGYVGVLARLRHIADAHAVKFESEGFTAFFTMLVRELDDEYLARIRDHLRELKFRNGALLSAGLRTGNVGDGYILRKPREEKTGWMKQLFAKKPQVYTFKLHPRDTSGATFLTELKDRGINRAANALAQSGDHIQSFIDMLIAELAFYIGCLNLHEQLARMGSPASFPAPVASSERRHAFRGLYDVCLALTMERKVMGSDALANHKDFVIVTGANQGGKSTFLRSIGLAQLMMQCGMFVPAESFSANLCDGLFTHYRREEDAAMKSGKLDEELGRMSDIVDRIRPNALALFNESFAATNEREGSEIARQIVGALLEKRIKVFFVTHLYDFAHGFYDRKKGNAVFLRAERQIDGERPFKIIEGEPLQTSYGEDLYRTIFVTEH